MLPHVTTCFTLFCDAHRFWISCRQMSYGSLADLVATKAESGSSASGAGTGRPKLSKTFGAQHLEIWSGIPSETVKQTLEWANKNKLKRSRTFISAGSGESVSQLLEAQNKTSYCKFTAFRNQDSTGTKGFIYVSFLPFFSPLFYMIMFFHLSPSLFPTL